MQLFLTIIHTPLGEMSACATEQQLCFLEFNDTEKLSTQIQQLAKKLQANIVENDNEILQHLQIQLNEYFNKTRQSFDLPLLMVGTPFQQQVWQYLTSLNYGETVSYQQQAIAIHRPSSVRAVANANGCNPLSIVVPCHRVIGSNGKLTGYAGGLWRKQYLLKLENALL